MKTRIAAKIVKNVSNDAGLKYTHGQIGRAMDKLWRRECTDRFLLMDKFGEDEF